MTPARTDQVPGNARPADAGRSPTTVSRAARRGVSTLGAVALGVGGAFAVPVAAAAAPAPCEQADAYAAQSGAGLFRLNRLGTESGDVLVAEAKSALVARAAVNAAAVTRMAPELGEPLIQQAPPTHAKPARRSVPAADLGPFELGRGTLSSHAQWDPRMACGRASGDVTRAEAGLSEMAIGDAVVRVPKEARSLSTTAVRPGTRTVAVAGLNVAGFELLDGAVRVKVLRPPALTADMSTKHGGQVRYTPAVLEVSGEGIEGGRLDTAGDVAEFTLGDDSSTTPDGDDPESGPAGPESTTRGSGGLGGLLSGLPKLDGLTGGLPMPLPVKPVLPEVGGATESARVTGPGTRLRISLGGVRKATSGHAIAAKATAINIAITQGPSDSRTKDGYAGSDSTRGGVVLDLDVGVLEAAAVAPEARGGIQAVVSGGSDDGGLPITGPAAGMVAIGGVALLAAGVAAVMVGMRRRRFRL